MFFHTVPDSPTITGIGGFSGYSIHVSWKSPAVSTGLITKYEILRVGKKTVTISGSQVTLLARISPVTTFTLKKPLQQQNSSSPGR